METKQERMLISLKGIGRRMLKDVVKHPIRSTAIATAIVAVPFLFHNIHKTETYERGSNRWVSMYADDEGNRDRSTTCDEYAEVYKSLGLEYDIHNYIPLTIEQKEIYLDNHDRKLLEKLRTKPN